MSRRIAVVGSGYVGTVVAACFAHVGHSVVGVEVDPVKLDALNDAKAPFYEPGLDELLVAGTESGCLRFTDSYPDAVANSELIFICVGTPPRVDGSPNTDYVEQAVRSIASSIEHYHVIVNKSTVPVGTARWIRGLLSEIVEPDLFSVASNPEFLREGDAIQDFLHPERVLIGTEDEKALHLLQDLYRPIVSGRAGSQPDVPLLNMSPATAEMAKYASNAFLATKISFAN
jgi:UDPglucose 6-dehydrogenase